MILKADRSMFSRLLVINEKHGISLRKVLEYSLGPIAWSLANVDGTISKTVKSKLFDEIEKEMEHLTEVSEGAHIYDGMCLLQQLRHPLLTFGDASEAILQRITSNSSTKIFFVTDQYFEHCIKSCERDKRAETGCIRVSIQRRDQEFPKQLKKFLSVGQNKIDFVWFLLKDWCHYEGHLQRISGKEIYITIEREAYKIREFNLPVFQSYVLHKKKQIQRCF